MNSDWRGYVWRGRVLGLAALLAFAWLIPGTRICTILVGRDWSSESAFILAVAGPIVALVASAHAWRMLWPCPRCGRAFHLSWFYGNPTATRCIHCGLPKWTPVTK